MAETVKHSDCIIHSLWYNEFEKDTLPHFFCMLWDNLVPGGTEGNPQKKESFHERTY